MYLSPHSSTTDLVEREVFEIPTQSKPARPASSSTYGLTREQEYRLAKRVKDHDDKKAGDQLVRAHLRFVVAMARKYRRYGVPVDELVAEGNFGLAHALTKFDPDRGFRFVTYAGYWVRAYILNYIIKSYSMVGAGSGALRSKTFFRLRKERAQVAQLTDDSNKREELLAERMGVSTDHVRQMLLQLEARDLSLDQRAFSDAAETLGDRLVEPGANQESVLSERQVTDELRSAVDNAMTQLDPREQYIVEQRLMADAEDKLTLADIGRHLGVSRERARQLEARAKGKLKAQLRAMSSATGASWLSAERKAALAA